jgi:flagellar operon protein
MNDIRGLNNIGSTLPIGREAPETAAPGFKDVLKDKIGPQALGSTTQGLKFSNHAVDRMQSRGITLDKLDLSRIEQAIDKARGKGSKETLVLLADAAFIVNVKNNTVVTAMDRLSMKENVFTNIDSTIVL